MVWSLTYLLVASAAFATVTFAQTDPALTGTWTTKSRKVFTGPGFYDPVNDKFAEPALPGISYSFTDDGYYEEAYYRAVSNPTTPQCPSAVLQWQHGTYIKATNGSLLLTPIAVDGRSLSSDPCSFKNSVYLRYNQPEMFEKYLVQIDVYHNIQSLQLYGFDGTPMPPMWLVYSPPQMLPVQTLNPTSTATGAASATPTTSAKVKRDFKESSGLMTALREPPVALKGGMIDANRIWWIGAGLTALGGLGYFCI